VGALYGILGAADHTELRALGDRLAHRGREAAEWSPSRDLRLGIRGTRRIVDVQEHGPVAFEGAIDNRGEIAGLLRRRDADAVGAAQDAGLVFELVDSFGVEAIDRLAGQFAVAVWHGPERRLLLARDRLGGAPLYFIATPERFAFASEYKALLALDGVVASPDLDQLQVVHAAGWVSPGYSCLRGVFSVPPGCSLEVRAGRMSSRRYWTLAPAPSGARGSMPLLDSLAAALRPQVAGCGRIGVALGGGLDSALVADGASTVAEGRELHTIATGYGPGDPTLAEAARTARAVGSRHHTVVLDPADLDSLLPWAVWHLEEPAGGSEVAYLFAGAREAARHVTLVVSGLGIAELVGSPRAGRLTEVALGRLLRRPLTELQDYAERSVPPASLGGRALKAAYYRGRDFPAARVRGAAPLPPVADAPREALRRLRMQSSVERLFAGAGLRLAGPCADPRFVETVLSLVGGRASLALSGTARGDRFSDRIAMADTLDRMAVELISPGAVRERGFFEPSYVTALLRRGRGQAYGEERARRIWSLLLVELWARTFLDRRGAPPERPAPPVRLLDDTGASRSPAITEAR
jgi:asparagine synthetase B (glutamine-hydrolysing)